MVQFGMKVKQKSKIPEILEILLNNVIGLRFTTNDSQIISKPNFKEQTTIYKIPSNLNLKESCEFMYNNHSRPFTEVLGTIGYNNNDIIVLNSSHLCCDGKYLTFILDYLNSKLTDNQCNIKLKENVLPLNLEEIFRDEIKASRFKLPHIFVDEGFTRIIPQTPVRNTEDFSQKKCQYVSFELPFREFCCYNKEKKRCSGMSEIIWSSFILSAASFNMNSNRSAKSIFGPNSQPGVTTCVDMRQYLKDKSIIGWNAANLYSSVTVSAPLTESNLDENLASFQKRLRNDFLAKIQKGYQFAFLKTLTPPDDGLVVPGIGLEVSSIGPFYLSSKSSCKDSIFSDIFIKSSVSDSKCDPLFSFSSFSVINEGEDHRVFHSNMRYKSSVLSPKDADLVGKGTEFALKNLSPKMNVKEAIESIHQYQKIINK